MILSLKSLFLYQLQWFLGACCEFQENKFSMNNSRLIRVLTPTLAGLDIAYARG